jgi:trimethylamine:corrinoid methyltransferase-like protein
MAELTPKRREKLAPKEFGLPERARTAEARRDTGNYPMPDKAHARNAKSRAAQQREAGNLTKDELERIDRKADKVLDED